MRKISILLAMMMAGLVFSSCSKDDTIVKLKKEGTVKFYVRGYAIGSSGTEYTPDAITNGNSHAVAGYEIVLANGKSYKSDDNGTITITLPAGYYYYKVVKPNGYGVWPDDFDPTPDYQRDVWNYKVKITPSNPDDIYDNDLYIRDGEYEELLIQLIK